MWSPWSHGSIKFIAVFSLLVACSLFVTTYVIRNQTLVIDIQKNRYFHEFGEVETSAQDNFRWSLPSATLLFPQQWTDYTWFPAHSYAQIVQLRMQNPLAVPSLVVGQTTFAVDAHFRTYYLLENQQSVVSFVTQTPQLSPDQRLLGVPVFAASRTATIWTNSDYIIIWLQILFVCGVLFGLVSLLSHMTFASAPWSINIIHVGIWMCWWLISPPGSFEILLAWTLMILSILLLRWSLPEWKEPWRIYFIVLVCFVIFRTVMMWWHINLSSNIAINPSIKYASLPLVWEPYWIWIVCLGVLFGVRTIAGKDYVYDTWLLLCIIGCAVLSIKSSGYWPVRAWMNFLPFQYLGDWNGVWEFLRTSRVALPPLLLVTEFAIQHDTVARILYMWLIPRIILLSAMILAVFRGITSQKERWVRGGLLFAWVYAFTEIKSLDEYFVYDFFLGAFLLFAVHLAYRRGINQWHWIAVGLLLVIMDSMRPYGMLILAVVGPWLALRSWNIHRIRGVIYLCLPLLISVFWHGHHIINLGQMTWSNHAGFNFCNAWECPEPPHLLPESPPLAPGYWTNINTEAHQYNSQQLLKSGIEFQLTHPVESIERAGKLILNIVMVPYKTGPPDIIIGNGLWEDVYRLIMFALIVVQITLMLAVASIIVSALRNRHHIDWYMVGHASIIVLVLFIPNLVEYGENYRFIAGTSMWLANIPAWPHYRSFIMRWLAPKLHQQIG